MPSVAFSNAEVPQDFSESDALLAFWIGVIHLTSPLTSVFGTSESVVRSYGKFEVLSVCVYHASQRFSRLSAS